MPPPHFPRVLEEKAFSKGVVFEKESNHLSLCIIACSWDIAAGLHLLTGLQIPDPACSVTGLRCWGCSLQGTSLEEEAEASVDRGCQHT